MAEPLTQQETIKVPTARELQEQFDLPSYGKEESEEEQKGLTEDQAEEIERIINEANKKKTGTVSLLDKAKYVDYLLKAQPGSRDEAIEKLPEHLEKKAEHLQNFTDSVMEYFSTGGQLTKEGAILIEKYIKETGENRIRKSLELKVKIKRKIQENKTFSELLESPHLSENGQLTLKSQQLFDEHEAADEDTQKIMKKDLLAQLRICENDEKECEKLYKEASDFYKSGEFEKGEKTIGYILRLCQIHPDSPRMQVIQEWNERDLANMKDHTEQQKKIDELIFLRDNYESYGAMDKTLQYAKELLDATYDFLKNTKNRHGEKVLRKKKYKTRHLEDLYQEAWSHASALTAIKNKEEEKEENEGVLKKEFNKFYSNSNQADDHTTLLGVAEEETRKVHSNERTDEKDVLKTEYVRNEDIEGYTKEDLNEKTKEQEREVAVNFDRNNDRQRLRIIRNSEEINTGIVTEEGRGIIEIQELENRVGKKTERLTDDFSTYAHSTGKIDKEVLSEFKENMNGSINSGKFGKDFTKETRKDGLDVVRFGDDFKRSQRELGDFIYEHAEEKKPEETNNVINLAEEVRQQRLRQRHAA